MADLAGLLRQRLAVDHLARHVDLARLDDIENIFPHPVHERAEDAEARETAPGGGSGAKIRIAEPADAPADTGTGDQDIPQWSAKIDGDAQKDEWKRPPRRPKRTADAETPHCK